MKYGLIAQRLGHSFSPELHRMIGGYDYILKELPEKDLSAFFTERNFDGINVTIPYKETVLPYLDEIDPPAAAIGAVNTVVNRQGRLYGYNTDFGGMLALIRRMGLDLHGKQVLILGTGGTAKTAHAAAMQLGAAEVHFVSRSSRGGAISYSEAISCHSDADVLINATPCGMYPNLDECPIDLSYFPDLCGVVDAVYNPLSTRLVLNARQRKIPAQGGLYMLVAQAVLASELFTAKMYCEATLESVYSQLLRDKRNMILIGMPGSGKTSVGRQVAAMMQRDFVDLDQKIVEQAGKPITRIFAEDGEKAFRQLETQAIREIAGKSGLVIATGGGCILLQENIYRLRQNGCLILLNRPLEQLLPTEDRPLADSIEKLQVLFQRRMPLYQAAADQIISTENGVFETAQAVVRRFNEVQCP